MRNPARKQGFAKRIKRFEEQHRLNRSLRKGNTDPRTLVLSGVITTSLVVPEFNVVIDADAETPEWKTLNGFRSKLKSGTATLAWKLNGTTVATQDITTDRTYDPVALNPPIDLADGDDIEVVITAADGSAAHLSATFVMVIVGG